MTEKIDVIWGARDIAEAIGRPIGSVFHMLEKGQLDADKIGWYWCTTRARLQRQFAGSEKQQAA